MTEARPDGTPPQATEEATVDDQRTGETLGAGETVGADETVGAGDAPTREVRQRSELEIRWRQARNAPPPVVRAVLANLLVAGLGGVILLLSDWLASGGVLPSTMLDLGPLVYIAVVIVSGSLFTYLWVELPTGVPGEKRRSPWAAVLGFFASIPIVYLALVVIFEVVRPLLPG